MLLDANKIIQTIQLLQRRISERFPESGLARVCEQLLQISLQAQERADWIDRPIRSLRIVVWLLLAMIVVGISIALATVPMRVEQVTVLDFIQTLEAGINDIVLVSAAIFFLFTLESRIKRRRALQAIHELRSIAHIIDMHQLTKDPERLLKKNFLAGVHSPQLSMTPFQLQRYLDYCSEMLSLVGKVAALYVQNFDDPVALAASSEVEMQTTGLSRKIWQKIMIIHSFERDRPGGENSARRAADAD